MLHPSAAEERRGEEKKVWKCSFYHPLCKREGKKVRKISFIPPILGGGEGGEREESYYKSRRKIQEKEKVIILPRFGRRRGRGRAPKRFSGERKKGRWKGFIGITKPPGRKKKEHLIDAGRGA